MVSVLDENKNPLMPCSEKRARRLLEKREAKPYWHKGIFCIILQRPPKHTFKQEVCIGIDPGSKFNGYSIKSEAHTFLNLQVRAIDSVKRRVEERARLRHTRRLRKTPYRKCRHNRAFGNKLPPSTKARWQQHIGIIKWMSNLYSITHVALEDITAKSYKGAKKWNVNFSPLEVGKNWFSEQVGEAGLLLHKFKGFETAEMRSSYGIKKNSNKSKQDFYTHAMDAWCLANEVIGGHTAVDNVRTLYLKPLRFYRRKLHKITPRKKGLRSTYGGTNSMGIKRGTLVKTSRWGICYVGGSSKNRISLHNINGGKMLTQTAKAEDSTVLTKIYYLKEISTIKIKRGKNQQKEKTHKTKTK